LDSPLGWLNRDHRKMLTVDGAVGFVTGLCVGQPWVGDAARNIDPWRDTGVEIRGPAMMDLEVAFAHVWSQLGPPIPDFAEARTRPANGSAITGDVAMRIVATQPNVAGIYRFDQLLAALARRSIWLTDAYFVGTPTYIQALAAAAMDGVDVRILLPRTSDIPIVRSLSQTGYRTLLESGVRIFEWNGTMLHAKTAVADGRWARVGSTNLNIASWIGNWELDVVVEDQKFAEEMENMYLSDLGNATEIVLTANQKVRRAVPLPKRSRRAKIRTARGSASRAVAGLLKAGGTFNAAVRSRRPLGAAEAVVMTTIAAALIAVAALTYFVPILVTVPIIVICVWQAFSLLLRAYKLYASPGK
jgi:cardiolipin synthase A/B